MRLVRVAAIAGMLTLLLAAPALAGIPQSTDLQVTKSDSPDPVAAGANITYSITVTNAGPAPDAPVVQLTDAVPAGTTFVSFTAPAGWLVVTPAVGGTGNVTANVDALATAAAFTLVVNVNPGTPGGTVITNTATVTMNMSDSNTANNSATATTLVPLPPTPAASLADAAMTEPTPVSPLATLGFVALLVAALSATAVLATRRVRP